MNQKFVEENFSTMTSDERKRMMEEHSMQFFVRTICLSILALVTIIMGFIYLTPDGPDEELELQAAQHAIEVEQLKAQFSKQMDAERMKNSKCPSKLAEIQEAIAR